MGRLLVVAMLLAAAPAWAAQVCGTATGWGSDSTDCTLEDRSKPQIIVKARFYRAFCGVGQPIVLVDSLPATAGLETCFNADTSVCVTYFMTQVDAEGQESCMNGPGSAISFPRTVSVDPQPRTFTGPWDAVIDVQGRHAAMPLASGRYFLLRFRLGNTYPAVRETTVVR